VGAERKGKIWPIAEWLLWGDTWQEADIGSWAAGGRFRPMHEPASRESALAS
jgi:hypothetical protein